jgi:hypothetical protein
MAIRISHEPIGAAMVGAYFGGVGDAEERRRNEVEKIVEDRERRLLANTMNERRVKWRMAEQRAAMNHDFAMADRREAHERGLLEEKEAFEGLAAGTHFFTTDQEQALARLNAAEAMLALDPRRAPEDREIAARDIEKRRSMIRPLRKPAYMREAPLEDQIKKDVVVHGGQYWVRGKEGDWAPARSSIGPFEQQARARELAIKAYDTQQKYKVDRKKAIEDRYYDLFKHFSSQVKEDGDTKGPAYTPEAAAKKAWQAVTGQFSEQEEQQADPQQQLPALPPIYQRTPEETRAVQEQNLQRQWQIQQNDAIGNLMQGMPPQIQSQVAGMKRVGPNDEGLENVAVGEEFIGPNGEVMRRNR